MLFNFINAMVFRIPIGISDIRFTADGTQLLVALDDEARWTLATGRPQLQEAFMTIWRGRGYQMLEPTGDGRRFIAQAIDLYIHGALVDVGPQATLGLAGQ